MNTRTTLVDHRKDSTKFKGGVLKAVHALGGQFERAQMTLVPGGETFVSQQDAGVINFRTNWKFTDPIEVTRLPVAQSIASQGIYLEGVVVGSLGCTCDKVDERRSVEEIIASLPKVEGLRWIVGNAPTITRVLANHLEEHEVYLLPNICTWTADEYISPRYERYRTMVGGFYSRVHIFDLRPDCSLDYAGLFVLGVPAD